MSNTYAPLWISLRTALAATLLTFMFGLPAAYWVASYKGKLKGLIDVVFTLPLVLPPTVVGFLLLLLIGKNGPIGKIFLCFDKSIIFTWWATVISATVVAFPMMYRTTRGAFEQLDTNLLSAARTLGLSEFTLFYKIAMPLSFPGIIAGVVLSFARALGEFGATMMIAGNIPGRTQTMPVAIFFAVEGGEMDKAILWVLLILGFSIITLLLLNDWGDRKQKTLGKGRG